MGDRLNPVEGQHIFTTVFITFPRFFLAQAPGKPCRSQTNRSCCKIAISPITHDGESVLRDWTRLRPNVIVLDISMGDLNGIEVARRLRNSGFSSPIIFLTVHRDPDFVKAALDAGGSGYVVKSRMGKDLPLAIDAAFSGKRFVSLSIAEDSRLNL